MPVLLYVIDTLQTGGAERSTLEIVEGLKGWDIHLVYLYADDELAPFFSAAGVTLHPLELTGAYDFQRGVIRLRRLIWSLQPDLVHAVLFRSEFIARLSLWGNKTPIVGSLVNDSYSPERYARQGWKQNIKLQLIRLLDRWSARRVDHFISITAAIIPNNIKALGIPPENITVIPRGRDVAQLEAKAKQAPDELPVATDNFVFLTVARLLRRKGLAEGIRAFRTLTDHFPQARYLIAGEGHDRSFFTQLIYELGLHDRVHLLGNRSDVPALLARANCFVFPSHYEGQGGALVEAMIIGLPIIISDIPVLRESAEPGAVAIAFFCGDHEDLAKKMSWMITHPIEASHLGEQARQRAQERFSIEKVINDHDQLYRHLISKV